MSLLDLLKQRCSKAEAVSSRGNTLQVDSGGEEKQRRLNTLTPRERDVFPLLVEGFTLRETAGQLGISYSTVNYHMTAIYKKLGVRSRAELIIQYRDCVKK